MTRSIKSFVIVSAIVATTFGAAQSVSACGGRGGFSGGYARPVSYGRPAVSYALPYSTPSYSNYGQPSYSGQPVYSTPQYRQPAVNQAIPRTNNVVSSRAISPQQRQPATHLTLELGKQHFRATLLSH